MFIFNHCLICNPYLGGKNGGKKSNYFLVKVISTRKCLEEKVVIINTLQANLKLCVIPLCTQAARRQS